jgi:hypothetical protein
MIPSALPSAHVRKFGGQSSRSGLILPIGAMSSRRWTGSSALCPCALVIHANRRHPPAAAAVPPPVVRSKIPARRASELMLIRLGRLLMDFSSSWGRAEGDGQVDTDAADSWVANVDPHAERGRPVSSSQASALIEDERQRRSWPYHLVPKPRHLLQHLDSEAGVRRFEPPAPCLQQPLSSLATHRRSRACPTSVRARPPPPIACRSAAVLGTAA